MKTGRTLSQLGKELQRQRNMRQDFIADTRSLSLQTSERDSSLTVDFGNGTVSSFGINELAHQQIAAWTRTSIPGFAMRSNGACCASWTAMCGPFCPTATGAWTIWNFATPSSPSCKR